MKSFLNCGLMAALVLCFSGRALAVPPPMPPRTSGSGDSGMKHAGVSLTGTILGVHIDEPPATPVSMLSGHGQDYTPAKFDVLENVFFNAQYGWLADGFISLPSDRLLWLERLSTTQPPGSQLRVFDGGNGAEGMAVWTMDEIFAADGDKKTWDGIMQHDYFTADRPGNYSMSFRVFVGDADENQDLTYTPAETTFHFQAVPEPAAAGLLLMGMLLTTCRRR